MSFELWATLIVFGLVLLAMFQEKIAPDTVMLCGLMILIALGVISIKEGLSGFSNAGLATIGAMYVIGAGLQSTGAMDSISRLLLGRPDKNTSLIRILAPVSALSAFMNNTPIVAFFLPVFVQMAKRLRISPSRLLIPLSYCTILGGCCTLVGTSTNLVVDSFLREKNMKPMGMFELAWVGLPIAVIGMIYLVTIGRRLLPDREDLLEHIESHRREYVIEMIVRDDCTLAGKTIREAGLRDLPGLYLFRIERRRTAISPVAPSDKIEINDILSFSGIASTVVDLQKIRGLQPIEHKDLIDGSEAVNEGAQSLDSLEGLPEIEAVKIAAPRKGRLLSEVVISTTSPLVGVSIKDANFRSHYNASILAVHRSGEKLEQKIGKIVLEVGDTLLVDADQDFLRRWRHSPDFVLVSGVEDSAPVAHERAWVALAIFIAVISAMSLTSFVPSLDEIRFFREFLDPVSVSIVGAVLMIVTGCVSSTDAHRSIQLSVILLVGSALGLSTALTRSGADTWLAENIGAIFQGSSPTVMLTVLYFLTWVLSEFLSNNATAAMMAALALAIAQQMGVDPRPFLIGVTVAASCAFATPIGYQTNLMVLGPGGYRFIDYVKVGLPLNFICMIVAILLIPWIWPFFPTQMP